MSVGGFTIDFSQVLPDAAPPLTVFAAVRGETVGFMAVQVQHGMPARARALAALTGMATPNLLVPLAHGPASMPSGAIGYFVICPAPPGRSLAATPRVWSEGELLDNLLKPAAATLGELQARNVSHRAIRLDNLFQAGPRTAVALGCAWAAPAAMHQPAWLEPCSSAACTPTGRGAGMIADDVYALGAVMAMLALGANPADGVPPEVLLRRKLEQGSFAALLGQHRLPTTLAELLRGMLADDPDHRPSPALLANPAAARARRIAARPSRRAQRPLEVGGNPAWTARSLAYELQADPGAGKSLLRDGSVSRWIRRGLGDGMIAGQVEIAMALRDVEASLGADRADALLLARAIAALDPAAPLVWRSIALWPDGIGPTLDHALHHAPTLAPVVAEIIAARAAFAWQERRDDTAQRVEIPDARMTPGANGTLRLNYQLNSLSPCESPNVGQTWVIRLQDLLPALEAAAGRPIRPGEPLLDVAIGAFIEARRDERIDNDLGRLAHDLSAPDVMTQLRLLARLQTKFSHDPLPQLSKRVADALKPQLERYSSRTRRERLAEKLAELGAGGLLVPIVTLLDDGPDWTEDVDGLSRARERLAAIDDALIQLSADAQTRPVRSRRIAHEVADGVGLLACVLALGWVLFA